MAPYATDHKYLYLQNHQLYNPYTSWHTGEAQGTDIQGQLILRYVPDYITRGIRWSRRVGFKTERLEKIQQGQQYVSPMTKEGPGDI